MLGLQQQLNSKTNGGLIILLIVVVGLALIGKLTPEAVDAIKWLGASFMVVRTGANLAEKKAKPDADN